MKDFILKALRNPEYEIECTTLGIYRCKKCRRLIGFTQRETAFQIEGKDLPYVAHLPDTDNIKHKCGNNQNSNTICLRYDLILNGQL